MSHEVYGKIATVRPSWHGKDNIITDRESHDIDLVAKKAGMNYELEKTSLFDWESNEIEQRGIRRLDNKKTLAIVSNNYKIVQPKQVLEFFREVVEEFGWNIETAGVLKGGKVYWASAKTRYSFIIGGANEISSIYLNLLSSCDGSLATCGYPTNVFTVCWNTLNYGLWSSKKECRVTAPHSTPFDAKYFKERLGIARDQLLEGKRTEQEFYTECACREISSEALSHYFTHVVNNQNSYLHIGDDGFDNLYDLVTGEPKKARTVTKLIEIMSKAPGQKQRGMTLWGAINAVTYWCDHVKGKDENRGFNVLTGKTDNYKYCAVQLAKEFIGS